MTSTQYIRDEQGAVKVQIMPLYRLIAQTAVARRNCIQSGNTLWDEKHSTRLLECEDLLPSGSGIDNGTKIDLEMTNDSHIVLNTAYHHMNENGYYDGWTDHRITIKPTFDDIDIIVGGRDRNDIKDYLADVFRHSLCELVEVSADGIKHHITPN